MSDEKYEPTSDLFEVPVSILSRMKEMFPTPIEHMRGILKLYKFCFSHLKKQTWEKSEEDVIREITESKNVNLSGLTDKQTSHEIHFGKQVAALPALFDFIFVYYVWLYDNTAPICKMPNKIFKFNLIIDALPVEKNELYHNILTCVTNNFISDIRMENPPYMMRTQLTTGEIKTQLLEVKKLVKNIINSLLKQSNKYYSEDSLDSKALDD